MLQTPRHKNRIMDIKVKVICLFPGRDHRDGNFGEKYANKGGASLSVSA
jgi:hypothetical protein